MKIKLTTDSSCDVSPEVLKQYNINYIPFTIILNGEDFTDTVDINPQKIFDFVTKTGKLPKTAANSIESFKAFFEKEMEGGYDIIYLGIGNNLSSSSQNAALAAEQIGGGRVHVIDSKSLSTGTTLLLLYANDLIREGKLTAAQIADKVRARVDSVQASFVVDTLEYLHKGGRCSMLAMFGANLLRIKPRLQLVNGAIVSDGKYRGKMFPVYLKYIDDTLVKYNNPDKTRCFVTHACLDDDTVKQIVEYVKAKNIFKEVLVSVAGCTVSSHCGKGTFGILYINDGGNK